MFKQRFHASTSSLKKKILHKFHKLGEVKTENFRDDLIKILRTTVGLDLDPKYILDIHKIPWEARKGPRPVIAKFRTSETKIKIILKRQNDQL